VFYKHGHLEKKLRENGRSARAEILSMRTEGGGNDLAAVWATDDDLSKQWTLCWFHLRVMPDGEPSFEASVRGRLHTFKYKGDTVPVLYDPGDHDKVVVDAEADLRESREQPGGSSVAADAAAFADNAAAFADNAAAFREQAADFRETTDVLSAIMAAKAAGNQAEVDRLKAEFMRRRGSPG
jgi:hypothetical protein